MEKELYFCPECGKQVERLRDLDWELGTSLNSGKNDYEEDITTSVRVENVVFHHGCVTRLSICKECFSKGMKEALQKMILVYKLPNIEVR